MRRLLPVLRILTGVEVEHVGIWCPALRTRAEHEVGITLRHGRRQVAVRRVRLIHARGEAHHLLFQFHFGYKHRFNLFAFAFTTGAYTNIRAHDKEQDGVGLIQI